MNWFEFISSLVGSLAWPVLAFLIAIILRQPLAKMLTQRPVKVVEAGPTSVRIEYVDEKLEEAKSELVEARAEKRDTDGQKAELYGDADQAPDDFMVEMEQLAAVAPSAVILESFARLEMVLRNGLEEQYLKEVAPQRRFASARQLARFAVKRGLITESEAAAFDDVAVVRNLIAHGQARDIDAERALYYVSIVRQLMISIWLSLGQARHNDPTH